MKATSKAGTVSAAGALLAGVLLASGAMAAQAQEAQSDPRWRAWLGCWEPAQPVAVPEAHYVCVIPAAAVSAVDVVSVVDGQITARERIVADGEARPSSRDDCTGTETSQWSGDGRRVYLRADHRCAGDLRRRSSGLLAISPEGDWLDVQSLGIGWHAGVRVLRYREVRNLAGVPDEVAAALQGLDRSRGAWRAAAAAPIGTAEVVDASRHADAAVVEAWLAERGEGFALDRRRLVELAEAGVPDLVIDMMVALSYPGVFTVHRPSLRDGQRLAEVGRQPREADDAERRAAPHPYGYGTYGWDYYGPFWYSPYGWGPYGAFGPYGYRGYYGGWYWDGGPAVIVVRDGVLGGTARQHGRVVSGRGYTQGGRSSTAGSEVRQGTGRSAAPRDRGAEARSGSSGSGSNRGSGSSSGSSGTRTAKPRP